jgi:AraC-like DNA-binding protein
MAKLAKLIVSVAVTAEEALQINYDAGKLAQRRGISLRHLERTFQAHFGRSPQEWLNELRLLAAQKLLASGFPVKAVALELRFNHLSYFCRVFRAQTGVTPSQFARLDPRRAADGD